MRINNNLMAMNTHRQLGAANAGGAKSMEKLSSGLRINRAGDDAAGLSISEKMRGQIRGLNQASANSQDGISMIQTAEGALNETHAILQRMRELAVQSSTDTNTETDRGEIQKEMDQLSSEITRIANNTEFNTQTLLNGGIEEGGRGEVKFHIGANEGQDISLNIKAMDAKSLGVARDAMKASVSDEKGVTSVEVKTDGVGTAVFDGGAATVSASNTAVKAAWEDVVAGLDVNTKVESSKYNDYKIKVTTGGAASDPITATFDEDTKTITLNGHTTQADWTTTTVNTALSNAGFSDLEATGASTAAAATITAAAASTTGLAKDEVALTITQGGDTKTAIVKETSTSVEFTGDEFKGIKLSLDGNLDNTTAATISFNEKRAGAATFADGLKTKDAVTEAGINVSSQKSASEAITTINDALETVSAERSKLGAMQNRLEHTIKNLDTSSENLQASEARIRDVDMAKEMMEQTKQNILAQASTAMLAQSMQSPQAVLQLLR